MSLPKPHLVVILPLLALACSGGEGGRAGEIPGDAGTAGSGGDPSGAGGTAAGGTAAGGTAAGGTAAGGAPAGGGAGGAAASCGAAGSTAGGTPLRDCNLAGVCGGCIAENACDLFSFQCAPDTACVCMAECVGRAGLGGVEGCLGTCGLTGSPPGFAELAQVVATMCPDSDECSVPAGFVPPPSAEPTRPGSSVGLGGGTLPDCSFDPGLRYDPDGPVLQLQSSDGGVCVRLERRNDGAGSNANTSFTLLDVRVGPLGQVCHAADAGNVCWHSSHHNFDDWAHAWCGNRHYDVNVSLTGHNVLPTYRLVAFEGGPLGATCAPSADGICPIGAPIELLPVP